MEVFAVIDTNVMVSYFLSSPDSPPNTIMEEALGGKIIPVLSPYLLREYYEVLHRAKFEAYSSEVDDLLEKIESMGVNIELIDSLGILLPDTQDEPIFELALATRDVGSFLITGNTKHFPADDFVMTPREMAGLLSILP